MRNYIRRLPMKIALCAMILFVFFPVSGYLGGIGYGQPAGNGEVSSKSEANQSSAPVPLLQKSRPVDWWFVFKFNASSFPGCGEDAQRDCLFGGTIQNYQSHYSQQFVYASSENPSLQKGSG